MNIYITTGTSDFLKKIQKKYPSENILLMDDGSAGILLHETEGKSVFNSPREFEVIESVGSLTKPGFAVLNHLPLSDEGRPIFEYQFKEQMSEMERVRGFKAVRLLRPYKGDTYIILTLWTSEDSYNNWKGTDSFKKAHSNEEMVSSGATLFTGPSFVNQYVLNEEG